MRDTVARVLRRVRKSPAVARLARRVKQAGGPVRRTAPQNAAATAGDAGGIDYEGAWSEYARTWRQKFPDATFLGDEWAGRESGAAQSVEEYMRVIEDHYIAPYVEPSDTVLEIGVGGGRTAVLLKGHAKQLVLADISTDMLAATQARLGEDGVSYLKLDGRTLDGVAPQSVDVAFCFDTLVHIEPRDIYNYLTRIPPLMRGKRLCVLHHSNVLSERGFQRFLGEWERSLRGRRHGRSFSVMTDSIMERFLDHLGYEVILKDTETVPRDCVWVVKAPTGS